MACLVEEWMSSRNGAYRDPHRESAADTEPAGLSQVPRIHPKAWLYRDIRVVSQGHSLGETVVTTQMSFKYL